MEQFSEKNMLDVVSNSKSRSEVCRKLKIHNNGKNMKLVNNLINEFEIDITHFKRIDYNPRIIKICPVCDEEFESLKSKKKSKTTCSISCSNTFFRSGEDHANWKEFSEYSGDELRSPHFSKKYRKLCFKYHKHECVVCGENKVLDVHHYDENRNNNKVENLIPICPTHHRYYHSKYKNEVKSKIDEYYKNFIK